MKMSSAERPINRMGVAKERQFTIKATGKAFRILSSGLYKEKILAIVRELSCNAYDAHVDAGKADLPFDVHLPNALEAFFLIRDYGKGLSQEAMETVYTTYFESTKTESNEVIGGLGLGCKSPLSYVDQFTVTSFHGGLKSVYSIFFDENETPAITLMSQEASLEPTGLEVKIPVRRESFYEFREKAQQVYAYFSPVPNVVGNAEYAPAKRDCLLKGDGFQINSYGNAKAIMGIVAYPLDRYSVPELRDIPNAINLLNMAIDIEFAVGDLDITAGREELSYDQKTKENIVAKVKQILEEIPDLVLADIAGFTTEMQVRQYYSQISRSGLRQCLPNGQIIWNGKVIDNHMFNVPMKDFDKLSVTTFDKRTTRNNNMKVNVDETIRGSVGGSLKVDATKDIYVITDNVGGRTMSRIRRFYEDHSGNFVLFTVSGDDAAQLDSFKAIFEGANFEVMSALPKPLSVRKGGAGPVSVKKWSKYSEWENTTIDAEGLFVRMSNSSAIGLNGREYDKSDFNTMVVLAKAMGFIGNDEVIYGIPKTVQKTMNEELTDDGSDWQDFFEYMLEQGIAMKDSVTEQMTKAKTWNDFSANNFDNIVIDKIHANLPEDHAINIFHANYKKAKEDAQAVNNDNIRRLFNHLNIEIEVKVAPHDLTAEWNNIQNTYPMMRYVMSTGSWYRGEQYVSELTDYIALVDAK